MLRVTPIGLYASFSSDALETVVMIQFCRLSVALAFATVVAAPAFAEDSAPRPVVQAALAADAAGSAMVGNAGAEKIAANMPVQMRRHVQRRKFVMPRPVSRTARVSAPVRRAATPAPQYTAYPVYAPARAVHVAYAAPRTAPRVILLGVGF